MAGRNQHHLPQSVLRGFARDPNEDPKRVWHYLLGAPIAAKATSEVAAQRDFYGKELDAVITEYEEKRFTPLLERMRALEPGETVLHDDATEYLGHLIPRGDHMRRVFTESMSRFLSEARTFIGDADKLGAHLGFDELEPGGEALKQIQKLTEDPRLKPFLQLMQVPPQLVERLGFALLREFAAPLLSDAAKQAALEFELMRVDVKGRVKEAHTDALGKVATGHRMPRLEHVTFSIVASEAELVLPDCVAIAINAEGVAVPLSMMKREHAALIVAPLAPHRIMIGRADKDVSLPAGSDLVEKLASCSHNFFVAESDAFRDLHARLGEVSGAEVDRLVNGVFDRPIELLPAGAAADPASAGSFALETPEGFTSNEIAELGKTLSRLAGDVHSLMSLECLAGVTVATLGDIDACGRYLVDPGAFDGITETGKLKLWAILPRAAGEALVRESSDEDHQRALVTATSALVRVSGASRLNRLCERYYRSDVSMHYRGIAGALPAYPSLAAVRGLALEAGFAQMVDAAAVEAFQQADQQIEEVKSAFQKTGDSTVFARATAQCVLRVACAGAAVAGLGEGALMPFPSFANALKVRGLGPWFVRYARDLQKFWDEPRTVLNPESWGIHSERLLLHWGIVSWYVAPGRVRFILPPSEIVEKISEGLKGVAQQLEAKRAPLSKTPKSDG